MKKISDIQKEYAGKLDPLDFELLTAHTLKKSREFVLAHPEYLVTSNQSSVISKIITRRIQGEPVAYILGHKEFYGLDFLVNKHTLVPRPETELMVEQALAEASSATSNQSSVILIDIGTGSGNIMVSITHSMEHGASSMEQKNNIRYFAIDISKDALFVAKKNAKKHGVDKKIEFSHGDLLSPLKRKCSMLHIPGSMIITANLPYLSKEIYESAPLDVKKYEPKSALYSSKAGLDHYKKLLKQTKAPPFCQQSSVTAFLEISPEQKQPITKLIKSIHPQAKTEFSKDLAGKWRICKISI